MEYSGKEILCTETPISIKSPLCHTPVTQPARPAVNWAATLSTAIGMTQNSATSQGLPGVEPLFIQHSDIPGKGQLSLRPYDICIAASETIGRENILGAQNVRGIWRLYCKSREKRLELLVKGISMRGKKLPMFEKNPRATNNMDPNMRVEKITIKDLPLSISNQEIHHYLLRLEGIHLTTDIRYGKERNANGELTSFLNGDRYAYAQAPIFPIIKQENIIADQKCRIFHPSQQQTCQACNQIGHKTFDPCCPAFKEDQHFTSVIAYTHPLSNMYMPDQPINYQGTEYKSVEHAYQALKAKSMAQDQLAQKITMAKHAGAAKAISKQLPQDDEQWAQKRIHIMEELLQTRAENDEHFCQALLETGDNIIVYPVKDEIWGTSLPQRLTNCTIPHYWPGKNILGALLMDLRSALQSDLEGTKVPPQQTSLESTTLIAAHNSSNYQSPERGPHPEPACSKTTPSRGHPATRVNRRISSPTPSRARLSGLRMTSRASSLPSTPRIERIDTFFKRKPSGTPPDASHHSKLHKPSLHETEDDNG